MKNDRFTVTAAVFTVGCLCLCLLPYFCDADAENCASGILRLVGGRNSNEGRVEICHENQWGTVCDDFWNDDDAKVVCRQLGLPTSGATAFTNARFGEGSGEIWLDNVRCLGTEEHLVDCNENTFGSNDCQHYEDAGVKCANDQSESAVTSIVGGTIGGAILLVCFLIISLSIVYGLAHWKQRRATQARRVQMTQAHFTNSSATVTIVPPSSNQAESGSSSETYNSQFGAVPHMENPPPYSEMDPLIDEMAEQDEELTQLPPCPQVEAEEVVD